MEEEKTPTTSDTEDVEAHGVTDRPIEDEREGVLDEPDVEAHGYTDRPIETEREGVLDRPSQD